jgi:hypothetical protein
MNPLFALAIATVCSIATLEGGKSRLMSPGTRASQAAAQSNSLYAVDVVGLRAGMTPRRVAQEAVANGWTEDTYSLETLEDIIRHESDRAQIGFKISRPKRGDLEVHFCNSKARFVRFHGKIREDEAAEFVAAAMKRLVPLGKVSEKTEELSHLMYYAPNSLANVSYTIFKYVKGQTDFDVWESVTDSTFCK